MSQIGFQGSKFWGKSFDVQIRVLEVLCRVAGVLGAAPEQVVAQDAAPAWATAMA